MCGISGYVSPRAFEGKRVLQRMNDVMTHRGPDDEGFYLNGPYGLSMRRLSIIDLSGGGQPIWNEDQTAGVVFNGEIYNFRQLREELLAKGHRFSTRSDTEVIVHLYEEEGAECVKRLNGMFAFALYDRAQDLLFLARDRMGEKPLHYYLHEDQFVFASEIKSILTFPEIETSLNFDALNRYLTFEYVPAPLTIYQNIFKLEAGHLALFQNGELTIRRYWHPLFQTSRRKITEQDAVSELRARLRHSVESRTVSDVALGAFLSGGIDSSLVTALLSQCSSRKVQSFSIAFDEPSFDESSYAEKAAQYLNTCHHVEHVTPESMLESLPKILDILDEPFADASMIPTYLLSRFTRRHVTVALSGDGGDELFAGYPTYQAHRLARFVPSWLQGPARRLADLLPTSDENISFDFKLRRFTSGLSYETALRNQIWLGSFEPHQKEKLFQPEILQTLNKKNEFDILRQYWNDCDSREDLDRLCRLDLRFYLQDDILFKVDRMSMAHSLEVRAPYLDHEFVEFVCSLPPSFKLKGLTTKYILKKAARGLLPEEIIGRSKKGFGLPIAQWIKGPFKEIFQDVLSPRNLLEGGIFNPDYVDQLLQEHLSHRYDHRKLLWTLFIFESWRQRTAVAVS